MNAPDETQHMAFVMVSTELLAHILNFPKGTKIRRVDLSEDGEPFRILVEHPDLIGMRMGLGIPLAHPTFGSVFKNGEHYEPHFVGWGQEQANAPRH